MNNIKASATHMHLGIILYFVFYNARANQILMSGVFKEVFILDNALNMFKHARLKTPDTR